MSVQPVPKLSAGPAADPEWISPEEYLRREAKAEFRSEYRDGKMIPVHGYLYEDGKIVGMAGASPEHNDINVNLTILLGSALRGGECWVSANDNPVLIIEVLSEPTEAKDRGEKFTDCWRIPTLREYVLVAQDRASVERFVRQGESDLWLYSQQAGLEATTGFESLGVELPLRDVYDGIRVA